MACSSPPLTVRNTKVGPWWLLDPCFPVSLGGHATGRIEKYRPSVSIIFLPFSCCFSSFFLFFTFFFFFPFFPTFLIFFIYKKLPKNRNQSYKGAWIASQEVLF